MPAINTPNIQTPAGDAFSQGLGQGMQAYTQAQQNKLKGQELQETALQDASQRALTAQDTITKTIQNKAAQMSLDSATAMNTQLNTPGSPLGESVKQSSKALGLTGLALSPQIKTGSDAYNAVMQSMKAFDDPTVTGAQASLLRQQSPVLDSLMKIGEANVTGQNNPRTTGNAINVGKDYDDNLKDGVQVNKDINKLNNIFATKDENGNPLITKQQMGDANAIISRLYSPNHMSDSTVDRTEYESSPSVFAGALQKLTANPTDIGSRQLIEHIVDQGRHIANITNQNSLRQLDNLDAGYLSLPGPAGQMASRKSADYRKMFSKQYDTMGENQSGNDPTILQYSKMHNLPYGQSAHILQTRGYAPAKQ